MTFNQIPMLMNTPRYKNFIEDYEFVQNNKENPNFNIPTIALTADAIVGAEEKYITDGFVDYIAKPFSKEQIEDKIYTIFNNPSDIIEKKNNK